MKKVLVATEMSDQQKALVCDRLCGQAEVLFLEEIGEEGLTRVADEIQIVIRYGGYKPFADELFAQMTQLEMVQLLCAGTDSIRRTPTIPEHVDACGAIGANSAAVAEHAFALMLAAAKRLPERDRLMRQGVFDQKAASRSLDECSLGIIGLGSIGTEVARRAKAFGMTIYGINRRKVSEVPIAFVGDLPDLCWVLERSDFVILTLSLTDETRNVITARELGRMKPDACLINVGRGELVNEADLYHHLRTHPSFFAGLDVWWAYPPFTEEIWYFRDFPYRQPFDILDNVILTPHCAALSGDYKNRMLRTALESVIAHLRGAERSECKGQSFSKLESQSEP